MRRLLCVLFFLMAGAVQAADFIPGIAIGSAGKVADPDKQQMLAFYIPAATEPAAVLLDVAKSMNLAALKKANLAVIGPDYALNARILKTALQNTASGALRGATILLVNGGEDTQDLKAAATLAGADFRAATYSTK